MDKYIINGGNPLFGEVSISGAKNSAVAVLPAALIADGVSVLYNVPLVSDILTEIEIFRELGVKIEVIPPSTVVIDPRELRSFCATSERNQKFRASYYLLGAFLSKFKQAVVSMPGGCNFGGVRPIDQHIKGFEALGATVTVENDVIRAESPGELSGASVYFDVVTVGGTINVMLAAALTPGVTVLENAAKEPHIVDLANYLNLCGADILGAGTDKIKIHGVKKLHG